MYKVVKTLDEITIDNTQPVFCDIESEGLYIDTRLVQLYQPSMDKVAILDTDILAIEDIRNFLKPLHLIFHNASYDLGTLNIVPAKLDDTLYLAKLAYPEWQKFTLDNTITNLGYTHYYEDMDKKRLQKSGFVKGAYLSDLQLKYSATDVIVLSKIWNDDKIQKARETIAYKVDILNLKYAIQYQQNGLVVSQKHVIEELDEVNNSISINEYKLNGLNPNSPKQVTKVLGIDSSAKSVLIKLISEGGPKAELADLVFKQRKLLKRRMFLQKYNYPKVYTRFNVNGAVTGRFTSSGGDIKNGINAQQIPRDLQYLFNQDTDDTVVIHADYSTAELRAGCSIMKEPNMYEELKAGKDLHKIAATLALGGNPEDITKEQRQKGKAISFGFIFGMSAPSFVEYAFTNYGVIFTQEEAAKIKANYQRRYPNIARYANEMWKNYKTTIVTTPLGHNSKPRLGTDAINHATQGCIAETTKLSIHYLCKEHPEVVNYIYNVVHDAIYLRVPRGIEDKWIDLLAKAMKKGWQEICKMPMLYFKDIPMPIEIECKGEVYEF